jgi:hypothetical protein
VAAKPHALLARCDELCRALDDAREVAAVVGIHDQAITLETNARRARNKEARRKAREIWLEAERKAGQLLIDTGKAGLRESGRATKGFRAGAPTGLPKLKDIGPYRTESQIWQRLAAIPQDLWDAALADSVMPTRAGMLRLIEPQPTSMGPSPKIHSISLSSIESPPYRLRALRPDVVDTLAGSMRDIGMINPITVGPREGLRHELRAGLHRLMAARKLGWEKISAIVLKGTDAVEAELVEIDENLVRADLTPAEQAAHHARRKELYEQKHPETVSVTRRGGPGRGKKNGRQNGEGLADRYTKDAAEKTGDSERTIQRNVERGENIPNVAELSGTFLDQGTELDALAKLKDIAPDRQAELIEKAKSGEKVSAKAEIKARWEKREAEPKRDAAPLPEQKPDAAPPTAPDQPAPTPDLWADQHASVHATVPKSGKQILAIVASVRRRLGDDPEVLDLCDWIEAQAPVRTAA